MRQSRSRLAALAALDVSALLPFLGFLLGLAGWLIRSPQRDGTPEVQTLALGNAGVVSLGGGALLVVLAATTDGRQELLRPVQAVRAAHGVTGMLVATALASRMDAASYAANVVLYAWVGAVLYLTNVWTPPLDNMIERILARTRASGRGAAEEDIVRRARAERESQLLAGSRVDLPDLLYVCFTEEQLLHFLGRLPEGPAIVASLAANTSPVGLADGAAAALRRRGLDGHELGEEILRDRGHEDLVRLWLAGRAA